MATYRVELIRTIQTYIEVEAPSARAARQKIAEYGAFAAWSDFPHQDEADVTRISSVTEA